MALTNGITSSANARSNSIEQCKSSLVPTRHMPCSPTIGMTAMSDTRFQPGRPKTGGRRKGSRDRIATALLEAIAEDFEKFGTEAVIIARKERPVEYLRVVASLLPKEFEITTR